MFFHKILQFLKFEGADLNKTKVFKILTQKYPNKAFLVKNTQTRHFGPKFRHFCFSAKFCSETNSMILISNMTILFSKASPKIPKSDIFGPKFRHFDFFSEILQLDYFESADFKYGNSFSKIIAQKYLIKAFLVKNTQISHFWSQI